MTFLEPLPEGSLQQMGGVDCGSYAPGFLLFFYDLESLVDDGYAQFDMYLLLLLGFWKSLRKEMGFR